MSRLPPAEHHHHHNNHAEGDSILMNHSREAYHGCSSGEVRDDSSRLSCQSIARRMETSRYPTVHSDNHMGQTQLEAGQGRRRDDIFSQGAKSVRANRKNEYSECWSMSLPRINESQGDGFTSECSRVTNTVDQTVIDYHDRKLKAHGSTNNSLKRSRNHSHSSDAGVCTSSKNERDSKSSCKWVLEGPDVRTSGKGTVCTHLKHNQSEEAESAACRQKNGKSRSGIDSGKSLSYASQDDDNVAGLAMQGNHLCTHREECAYSERSSSKSTSMKESHDVNVLIQAIPETGDAVSRMKIYSCDVVNISRVEKNSNSCPTDPSVSEIQLMSQAVACPATQHARKQHKTQETQKMASDVQHCSNDTSQSSQMRMNQAENNLCLDIKQMSKLNAPQEITGNIDENTANPSAGILLIHESRLTDHSQCTDVTQPTVTAAAPRTMPLSHEGCEGEPPVTKLINDAPVSREVKSEEQNTASPSADDLVLEYADHQDSKTQCGHAKENKWTLSYGWLTGEYTPDTKTIENNSHSEQSLCTQTKPLEAEERTATIEIKRIQPIKSPRKEHNYEAKETDFIQGVGTLETIADRQGNLQESRQFDESDIETLDSKSRRLLSQLQMVQMCKRKANVLLKHVQSIIDGSHTPTGNARVNKPKGQHVFSNNSEEFGDDAQFSSLKCKHKSRPKSESPAPLRRKPSGKIPASKTGENFVIADTSEKLTVETLSAGIQAASLNVGFTTEGSSVHAFTDYTMRADEELGQRKNKRLLGRSELLSNNHGEEVNTYYKVKTPNMFDCEATKHSTALDLVQQRQLQFRGEKCLGPFNESELKPGQRCYRDNRSTGQKNYQAREVYSNTESPDRRHSSTKYSQWMSATTAHGAVSTTNYYETVSNTSESVNSFVVYDNVGSARYQNGEDLFVKDDKYYHLLRQRGANSITRSHSAIPHTSKHQRGLHHQHKMNTKGKRYQISRSSMRQSLKEAIKSAKQSISAAAKVAEALSFVVKASPDSSTSLSSEAAGKRPVWKQRHHSKSPAAKAYPADNTTQTEAACKVTPEPPFNGRSVWPEEEEQLYKRSFQENIEQSPYRYAKNKRSSSLQQRLNDETFDAKSSAPTHIKNVPTQYYQRHMNSRQNLGETETKASVISHEISHSQPLDSSPHTWDGARGVTKYFSFEGPRIKDCPALKPDAEDSPVVSPTITVQITISKSPDPSPQPNVTYLVEQSMHRKENQTQEACHISGHKSFSSQRPLSEYEQSSELTSSKENWTASHSCCSTRKTSSYFNEATPVEDRLLRDYASSTRRDLRRHTMNAYVDGSANNYISESVKYNANVNRTPISNCSLDNYNQNTEQIKMGEKSKRFITKNPRLSPNGNRRKAEQRHNSCDEECKSSKLMLSYHQKSPMKALYSTSKRPKHSKANLCLSRSYKISHTTTDQGKVNSRYKSQSNQFYIEKMSNIGKYQYLHDSKGESGDIGIPVCYSDPSSPCVFNRQFEGLATGYSGELRTVHETRNHISQGKRRRCSSVNRQYAIQEMSPRGAFFPRSHFPEVPATTGNRRSYLEYESEHSQTTLYVEMEQPFLVHSTKIKSLQIPQSGVFPLSGPKSSSIEFTAICNEVQPGGDGEETSPSWDHWPHHPINHRGSSENVNNNNLCYVSEDNAEGKRADDVSGIRECLIVDPVNANRKTVTGSRLDLEPEAMPAVCMLSSHDFAGQQRARLNDCGLQTGSSTALCYHNACIET